MGKGFSLSAKYQSQRDYISYRFEQLNGVVATKIALIESMNSRRDESCQSLAKHYKPMPNGDPSARWRERGPSG
jgi:hypothetical protein